MRFSGLALALPFVDGAAALLPRQVEGNAENTAIPVAKSFIIEYSPGSARRRQNLESTDGIKVVKTFDSSVFSGASIETDTYNLDSLSALPDVAKVWPNQVIHLDPIEPQAVPIEDAPNYTTHNATGVSKLHAEGIFGQGVKVGIVDTGVWYYHPALGGGFGPGFKIAGGYDLVGDGFWPSEGDKVPDPDPLDQQGHGTHVSGIVAGKTEGWTGVAPEATLYLYKVFSQDATTDSATLIDAFLAAYNDGVDVITSSIGGADGWSNNAWAEVASRLVNDEGVVVTISAGNSGSVGPFFGSSGSSGKEVLAIASVETELFPATPFEATYNQDGNSTTVKVGYLPSTYYFPTTIVDWPIVSLSLDPDAPADGCDPYPEGTIDLTGVIPLVRRGTCTFQQKQENLAALGAEYILIFNDERPLVTPSTGNYDTLIALIPAESGESIIETIKAGGNVTADFSVNPEIPVGLPYPAGNRPNTFTSWGGLYDLQIKPDIAAPGGNIFSTYLDNSYAILSGTSMACPYVAGVAALYIGKYGGRSVQGNAFAKALSRRIISSGTALPWSDGTATDYGYVAPVAQVGNGLIDAFKVLHYDTDLQFEKIALNDTRYFSRYHDITVTNTGSKDITYKLSSQDGAGVDTLVTTGTKRVRTFTELVPKSLIPDISLPRDFTLKPGQSKTVSINFKNPDTLGWNASALPLYGGKIIVSGSNGDQLSVPYLGLGGDLRKEVDPIYRAPFPISYSTRSNIDISSKSYYTFNLSVNAQDFPKIFAANIWGTREVRWDIFEAGWSERQWSYPPVVGENGYVGSVASWVGSGQVPVFNPDLYDPDETFSYPITDLYRNTATGYFEHWWFGKLSNGSQIALGNYTSRFATLKPFGNPTHADNWDVFKSPQISVLGQY